MSELTIEIIVNELSAEYFACGSHQILLKLGMDIDDVIKLYERLRVLIEEEEVKNG